MDGIGDRLRQARMRAGMTLAELWWTANVSVPALSRLEQRHTTPKPSTVLKLARAGRPCLVADQWESADGRGAGRRPMTTTAIINARVSADR